MPIIQILVVLIVLGPVNVPILPTPPPLPTSLAVNQTA